MEKSRLGPCLEGGPDLTNPKTDGVCMDLTQELLQGDHCQHGLWCEEVRTGPPREESLSVVGN